MPTTYGKLIRNGVNFSHDTAKSISYDNTTSGLTATDIQSALDEIASGAGGHNIKNDAGTTLTQRSNLKFKGTYAHDDSTNGDTVIENIREMTESQYSQLSDAEKKGIILTDTEHDTPVFLNGNMVVYDENNTVTQAINNRVSKSGDTMTGNLTINQLHSGTSNVSSFIYLGNNIPEGQVGSSRGVVNLYGKGSSFVQLVPETITSNRTIYFPDNSGTLALTSDITPTKTQFTPTYGASSTYANRNFFVTDNVTFLEVHFCLSCATAINANVDLITLPTIAQNKIPQYGVGVETTNNKAHLVYNSGNYLYLDGTSITADSNGVFSGTFRMSLL